MAAFERVLEGIKQVLLATEEIKRLSENVEQSVERGLLKGVKQIPSAEVLRDTTRTLSKTGGELLEQGLGLLGVRKPRE